MGSSDIVELICDTVIGREVGAATDPAVRGGTMNREAAALGVRVWSVYPGPPPHIGERLAFEGRPRWVWSGPEIAKVFCENLPQLVERRGPFHGAVGLMVWSVEDRL